MPTTARAAPPPLLGRYRVLAPLSAGPDGAAYQARDERDRSPVEVRRLSAAAAASLRARLPLLARAGHPGVLRVLEARLDGAERIVVVEAVGRTLAELEGRGPLLPPELRLRLAPLAEALAGAHRLGLVHGRLDAGAVRLRDDGSPCLDLTGLDVGRPGRSGARAPAHADEGPAGDVRALGLLARELAGEGLAQDGALSALVGELLAPAPEDRPPAAEVARRLASAPEPRTLVEPPAAEAESEDPRTLGRFELLEKLGEGAMGRVYRARDVADGSVVAVKVLLPELARSAQHLRRFEREARLLARLRGPNVAALLEVNRDRGRHFLAMEYVEGPTLSQLLRERGRLGVEEALSLATDLALADVHALGIVHRDVKPGNVLVSAREGSAKLVDFGVARLAEPDGPEADLTRAGALVGSPHFMSPEQCAGLPADARADVYALGVTLFRALAGRLPFEAADARGVIAQHLSAPPPSLRALAPEVGDGVVHLVARMLAKEPAERPADGAAVLDELLRLRGRAPAGAGAHPAAPAGAGPALRYEFEWALAVPPARLWPFVADTNRVNKAIGLEAFALTYDGPPDARVQRARTRLSGLDLSWVEHPFEWVEGRRFGVVREFSEGPFTWFRSVVDLRPDPEGGTRLVQVIEAEPRGLVGRAAAALEIGVKAKRNLGRLYERVAELAAAEPGPETRVLASPFEEPHRLSAPARARLDRHVAALLAQGVDADVVERLSIYVASAPAAEVARLRPRELARRFRVEEAPVVEACLRAAAEGMLALRWDLLCPVCRVSSGFVETLRAVREHARCEACGVDFPLDLGRSVELAFRVSHELREADHATYCSGGPARLPHVALQVRLAADERLEVELGLGRGTYRLASPALPTAALVRVAGQEAQPRLELPLGPPASPAPLGLREGRQLLVLENRAGRELLVRLERTAGRDDALTAAEAASSPLFRALFPAELLERGRLVQLEGVTLLAVDAADAPALYRALGEPAAFARLHELRERVAAHGASHGGAAVKALGDGLLLAFGDAAAAGAAAVGLRGLLSGGASLEGAGVRAAAVRGPALVATVDGRLDYFGSTAHRLLSLLAAAGPGELLVGDGLAEDPAVAPLLAASGATVAEDGEGRAVVRVGL